MVGTSATSITSSNPSASQIHNPTTNPTTPFSSSLPISNISSLVPIKLTSDNYILWKSLWQPILKGFDLLHLVDGSATSPPSTISTTVNNILTTTINPDFQIWNRSDQTLLIWLNATISESLLSYVVGFPTSRALCQTLEQRFSTISRSHVLQLRTRLQMIRKGSLSISQYLQGIKSITDNLAAAGSPVEDGDLVFHILHGLPSEYNSFVTSIRVRDPPVTADTLHGLLLSEELSLEDSTRGLLQFSSEPRAFQTSNMNNFRGNNFRGNHTRDRGRGRSPQSNRGGKTPIFQTSAPQNKCFHRMTPQESESVTKPPCQICDKPGHSAFDCFNRMNHAYQGRIPPSKLSAMVTTPHSTNPFAAESTSNPWYLDFGATNHIVNSMDQLSLSKPYNGQEKVAVGNGDGLPITRTGFPYMEDSIPRFT